MLNRNIFFKDFQVDLTILWILWDFININIKLKSHIKELLNLKIHSIPAIELRVKFYYEDF